MCILWGQQHVDCIIVSKTGTAWDNGTVVTWIPDPGFRGATEMVSEIGLQSSETIVGRER